MTVDQSDPVEDAVEYIVADFRGAIDAGTVRTVAAAARRDLDGQIPTVALPEFVYRLTVQRLRSTRPARGVGQRQGTIIKLKESYVHSDNG